MAETDNGALFLHRRLCDGDPVAPSALVHKYLRPLSEWLRSRHPNLRDPHMIEDAATDALLNYAQRPEQFNPERGTLDGYLRMASEGDLRNALRGLGRRAQHELADDALIERDVAVAPSAGNEWIGGAGSTAEARANALESEAFAAVVDPDERVVLSLMFDGVRETDRYAHALGISDLAIIDQRRQVKRIKDRLVKRLRRRNWGSIDA